MAPARRAPLRRGFTLVELLTVIGIIILLLAILLPVVSQVRVRANVANTQQQMSRIMSACVNYYHEFDAYPGPLLDSQVQHVGGAGNVPPTNITGVTPSANKITSSENLVLGLLYYLKPPPTGTSTANPQLTFIPDNPASTNQSKSSHDPVSLNPLHPATYHFIDYLPDELDSDVGHPGLLVKGQWIMGSYTVTDSSVPEFLDKIPDPMPILYMRARTGATLIVSNGLQSGNQAQAQYDRSQLAPYGFTQVTKQSDDPDNGFSTKLPAGITASDKPEWVTYMMNPNILGQAKGKDGFILISAGPDRKYGTKDDIIVAP